MELIKAKRAGKRPPVVSEERPSNVINLMDALRRSARSDDAAAAAQPKTRRTIIGTKRAARKKEGPEGELMMARTAG